MFYFLQAICLFAFVGTDSVDVDGVIVESAGNGKVLNVLCPLTEWCEL